MANKYLIVVDMQNDFVDGALGSQEAKEIVSDVVEKVKHFEGTVIYTRDTHKDNYLDVQEGRLLPVKHCVEGSEGWKLIPQLEELQQASNNIIYNKLNAFGSVRLAQDMLAEYNSGKVESIELIGLCTDICVVTNALLLKAFIPELPIYVDSLCCAGVTPEKHNAALDTMKSCQIIVK
jgi:nicotinamidase-related amidase